MTADDIEQLGRRLRFWPRWRETPSEPQFPVLAPYRSVARSKLRWLVAFVGLVLFSWLYGFFFSLFAPNFLPVLLLPLVLLAFLVIWVLPDVDWAPTRALRWFFFATLVALVGWPDYLAIALPGLPWITFLRITSFPTAFIFLICLSMSGSFRSQLFQALKAIPAIPILLGIFSVIQLISIGLSPNISGSIQKFIVALVTWVAIFFVATYIFVRTGQIKRWALILWGGAVFVSFVSIWEYRIGHLPWVGHIPSFLQINDESVERILAGSARAGTDRYRAQATFGTPLGLAEYLALTLPFVLHFTTRRFHKNIRIAAMCSIPLFLYSVYLTDAKLGTIGCLIDILLYVFLVAFENWRRDKSSLLAASVLYSYPLGFLIVMAAVIFMPRLHVMILGGSSHAASTGARIAQYSTGVQKLMEWPFGYGIGQGAATLGFTSEAEGMITIDTYYLTIALEYGIAGFIVYFGMFAIAIYEGCKRVFLSPTKNEGRSFMVPITISLISFIVIKSVFSQQDNHPIVFMMLGALVALAASQKVVARKSANAPRPSHRIRSSQS